MHRSPLLVCLLAACGGADGQSLPTTVPASGSATRALLEVLEARSPALADRPEEVLARYEAALREDADHSVARAGAASAAWRLGRFEECVEHYEAVQGARAEVCRVWHAHALAAAGRTRAAQAAYDAHLAETLNEYWAPVPLPGSPTAETAPTVLHWSRAARQDPAAVHHWLHGNALVQAERYEEARAAFRRALEASDDFLAPRLGDAMAAIRLGDLAAARASYQAVLEDAPQHRMAQLVACLVEWEGGDAALALPRYEALVDARGARTSGRHLARGAIVAQRRGAVDFGLRCVDLFALRECNRLIVGNDDQGVLESFRRSAPANALERYALASSLFGYVSDALAQGDLLSFGFSLQFLEGCVSLSAQDRAASEVELEALLPGDQVPDFVGGLAAGFRARFVPYLARARRELTAALAERPGFEGARVLLALMDRESGREADGVRLLREVLERNPRALGVRLDLSRRLPLDVALELMEGSSAEELRETRAASRLAFLERDGGDGRAAAERALATLRGDDAYWDLVELVAEDLAARGEEPRALALLDASIRLGRSGRGALLRATLRLGARAAGCAEALIDAWRAAARGSVEEARCRELLRTVDSSGFVCGRCGGSGTISVTRGTTGDYGSIYTEQEWCPQCQGLGLWHAGTY